MNDSNRRFLNPPGFTPTLGAYSHGLVVPVGDSDLIFVTGQIAMDKDGKVVAPGNAGAQTEFVFQNIATILKQANATLDDVVKVQIFLTNINDFASVSPVRNKYFTDSKPASTLVEVSKLVKPGCVVEVEVVAVKRKS